MIIESSHLKKVLDLLNHSCECSRTLEVYSDSENLNIGVNYGDRYYIKYTREDEEDDKFKLNMPEEMLDKLHQMVTIWPKSCLQIGKEGEHHIVEITHHGKLLRENPVYVDCIFEEVSDGCLTAPEMKSNISVNAKNLKQMLEFCSPLVKDEMSELPVVLISMAETPELIVNNTFKTIGTRVQVDEFFHHSSHVIKLSAEALELIIEFLTKLGIKTPSVYFMFLEKDYAFSIQVQINNKERIQIYTIHE